MPSAKMNPKVKVFEILSASCNSFQQRYTLTNLSKGKKRQE